ncbi:hypothetical protein H072_3773 [Dactylellina haptotyla CBS 200.50]|uniref:Extracellular membrane protein CFEM domain-containing protein n=1 Tax=Dactylellina haptotyla (strain CBS 200.50) TaxID=1284197 RepID=S8C3H4_DACHA|nr:hypothetical protein H072_3773 [Dactylellina haptotyla CBS 200.50]
MRFFKLALLLGVSLLASPSFTQGPIDTPAPDPLERDGCGEDKKDKDNCATAWTETVTQGNNIVVLVHPHADTRRGTAAAADVSSGSYEGTGATAAAHTAPTAPTATTSTSVIHSATISRLLESIAENNESIASEYTANAALAASLDSQSNPSSAKALKSSPMETATEIHGNGSTTSSSSSSPFTHTPTKTAHPLDSAEIQICTGGSYKNCIAAYPCEKEPTDAMKCFCRNNVAQGCNDACGGYEKVQPEECPLTPVGEKPSGLPGAGDPKNTKEKIRRENSGSEEEEADRWHEGGGVGMLWGFWPVGEGGI